MMSERSIDMERTHEKMGKFLGRLVDFGLGSEGGIVSEHSNKTPEELNEIAEQDAKELVEPTDVTCTACIDGRCTLCNADGSEKQIRLRRAGGSASDLSTALNADASIVETFQPENSLDENIAIIAEIMSYDPSVHTGGCGSAKGEIADQRTIATNPAIMATTRAVMEIPEVRADIGTDFSDELAGRVRSNASGTAEYMEKAGWDEKKFVEDVTERYPQNVEELEVDESAKHHGHKEKKIVFVLGEKTLDQDDAFVINIEAIKRVAKDLAGQRGPEGYTQAFIAELAKHVAVASRLCDPEMPIELVLAA